jgi:hypothetical protein
MTDEMENLVKQVKKIIKDDDKMDIIAEFIHIAYKIGKKDGIDSDKNGFYSYL